jgi:RNA polymerase sigma-70 factor (ECF subfamily)
MKDHLQYLPLDNQNTSQFLDDWEEFVLSIIRRMKVSDEAEAMSRVFTRALKGLPDFQGDSKLSTWMYKIAWREGLRQLKKDSKHQSNHQPIEDVELVDPLPDQQALLEQKESAATVRTALNKLPVRDKEILALRFLEELKFSEVAERLNISEVSARVRCGRALAKMKLRLEREYVA